MSTFYEFRMRNLFARYELPANAVRMLKALEEMKMGRLDEAGLGRLIRTSPETRASLFQAMDRCADIMAADNAEAGHCAAIMKCCTEMLSIAGKITPPHALVFTSDNHMSSRPRDTTNFPPPPPLTPISLFPPLVYRLTSRKTNRRRAPWPSPS